MGNTDEISTLAEIRLKLKSRWLDKSSLAWISQQIGHKTCAPKKIIIIIIKKNQSTLFLKTAGQEGLSLRGCEVEVQRLGGG